MTGLTVFQLPEATVANTTDYLLLARPGTPNTYYKILESNFFPLFDPVNQILQINGAPTGAANTQKLQVNGAANIAGIEYTGTTIKQLDTTAALTMTPGVGGFIMNFPAATGITNSAKVDITAGNVSGTGTASDFKLSAGNNLNTLAASTGGSFFMGAGNAVISPNAGGGGFVAQAGNGGAAGGTFLMTSGACLVNGAGGDFNLTAGNGGPTGAIGNNGGTFFLSAGWAGAGNSYGGGVNLSSGNGGSTAGNGGDFSLYGGYAQTLGNGGGFYLAAGNGVGAASVGGSCFINAGSADTTGGSITLSPGPGTTTNGNVQIYDADLVTVLFQTDSINKVSVIGGANLLRSMTTLTNYAAAAVGTLTNAPTAGNPTKWIAINDNGTIRKIPTWT